MEAFELKGVFPPKYCKHCNSQIRNRNLVIFAANEKEAILMRKYLMNEGFEC